MSLPKNSLQKFPKIFSFVEFYQLKRNHHLIFVYVMKLYNIRNFGDEIQFWILTKHLPWENHRNGNFLFEIWTFNESLFLKYSSFIWITLKIQYTFYSTSEWLRLMHAGTFNNNKIQCLCHAAWMTFVQMKLLSLLLLLWMAFRNKKNRAIIALSWSQAQVNICY